MRTKIITAIALLLQWLPIAGQNTLTSACNSPRAGDVLDEKVVQYISPDEGGWNMTNGIRIFRIIRSKPLQDNPAVKIAANAIIAIRLLFIRSVSPAASRIRITRE